MPGAPVRTKGHPVHPVALACQRGTLATGRKVRFLREHGSESPTATFQWRSAPIHWALTIGLAGEALILSGETLGNRLTPRGTLTPEGRAAWANLTGIVSELGGTWPGH